MTIVHSIKKSVDIGFLYILYFVIAICLLYIADMILGQPKFTIETPTVWLVLELVLIFFVFGVVSHNIQLLVQKTVFPYLSGVSQVSDFSEGTWVLIYTFLTCSVNVQDRLYLLYNRLMGTDYPLVYTNIQNRVSMFRR